MRLFIRCLFAVLAAASAAAVPAAAPKDNPQVQALHRLFEREWDWDMRSSPVRASDLGDRRFNDRWPDVSLQAVERGHAADEKALADLTAIDRAALPASEQINYDLFQWRYRDRLESYRFHEYLFPLNQLGGIQTAGDLTGSLRFATIKDYEDWLKRLQAFGTYMDQTIALLAEGVKEGRTLPKVAAERIPQQILHNIVEDPTQSTFYAPFKHTPANLDAAAASRLQADAGKAIAGTVVPAFSRMQKFFDEVYLPHCRTSPAVATLPDGKAYYAYLVRHFTTTDLTPEQVHELGIKKIAEIRGQMLEVMKQAGFKGGFQDFLNHLRSDPEFYYSDPKDLLEAYKAEAKTIDPLLVNQFGRLPRIPWGVKPIPADQAPNTYPAYSSPPAADGSRAAYMSVNLYKPETRPKYEIPVLTCHEGRPGHALQLSLATELTDLPNFRRFAYFNAYGEGWALYAETLCGEMGLYDDAYQRFGALSYQMWRAVRLVVDTGIHAYGMTREQAVQMFKDDTALTDQNIGTEVDRYIVWPGQALSYMIGEIKIQELRKGAEERLGSRFNLKEFHDLILENGTLPLSLLEAVVNSRIDSIAR
jgi:uncharacterized protein (DUF885 family)